MKIKIIKRPGSGTLPTKCRKIVVTNTPLLTTNEDDTLKMCDQITNGTPD
jgi:hypothetical protein